MGVTYRANSVKEQAQEARVADLLPATCERLRQACEHGEALASAQPRGVERASRWLLAAGASVVVLVAPLVGSFGRIDERPFASRPHEQWLLTLAILAGLVLVALAVRSFVLRRGGLPPGVFLFASGLVEIRSGRVRVWPLSQLRAVEQREVTTLDLGDAGRVRVSTDEEDLATALASSRARLSEAQEAQDTATIEKLDPLHLEQNRDEAWRELPGPTRPTVVGTSPAATRLAAAVGVLVALGLSVAGMVGLRRASDALGIRRAMQRYDARALASYVWAQGPLDEQADDAWFDMAMRDERDQGLLGYMSPPGLPRPAEDSRVRRIHRFAEADARLARRLTEQTSRGQWRETAMSRLVPPDMPESESTSGDRGLPLKVAIERIDHYLAIRLPGQPFRSLLERRLLKLRVIQSDSQLVCPSSSWPGVALALPPQDDPLAVYLDNSEIGPEGEAAGETRPDSNLVPTDLARSDDLRPEAHYIRWMQHLSLASQCCSLGDLEKARPEVGGLESRSVFEGAWKSFFEGLRAATARAREATGYPEQPSPAVFDLLEALWGYLAEHPETSTWGPSLIGASAGGAAAPTAQDGWGALLRPHADKLSLGLPRLVVSMLGHALPMNATEWRVHTDGPHLEFLRQLQGHDETWELTLFLPGSPARRVSVRPPGSKASPDDVIAPSDTREPHSHVVPAIR